MNQSSISEPSSLQVIQDQESSTNHHDTNIVNVERDHEENGKSTGVYFFPPLYAKRYSLAVEIIMKYDIKSIVDFGCAEGNFIKHLSTVPCLETVALVDINRELLIANKKNIVPELRHFIFKRSSPLHVSLMAGSAGELDSRCFNYEAVTMIELIEHLYPDELKKVTHNVFNNLRPKLCIVTTPNSEFNVLFKNSDSNSFRHWDHKFEWNRKEFKNWCEDICNRYDYTAEYTGVGLLSDTETHHLGFCTQMAIFFLNNPTCAHHIKMDKVSDCYELIAESDFPYEKNICSTEEKIDLEVNYCVKYLLSSIRKESASDEEQVALEISEIVNFPSVKAVCDKAAVIDSLLRSAYHISEDKLLVYVPEEEGQCEEMNNENQEEILTDNKDCTVNTVLGSSIIESWD